MNIPVVVLFLICTNALSQFSPLHIYYFVSQEEITLSGTKNTQCKETSKWSDDDIAKGNNYNMTFVITKYKNRNFCFNDGRYNNADYKVEIGTIESKNGDSYPAFKIHPPSKIRTKFLASQTLVYFSFPSDDVKKFGHLMVLSQEEKILL